MGTKFTVDKSESQFRPWSPRRGPNRPRSRSAIPDRAEIARDRNAKQVQLVENPLDLIASLEKSVHKLNQVYKEFFEEPRISQRRIKIKMFDETFKVTFYSFEILSNALEAVQKNLAILEDQQDLNVKAKMLNVVSKLKEKLQAISEMNQEDDKTQLNPKFEALVESKRAGLNVSYYKKELLPTVCKLATEILNSITDIEKRNFATNEPINNEITANQPQKKEEAPLYLKKPLIKAISLQEAFNQDSPQALETFERTTKDFIISIEKKLEQGRLSELKGMRRKFARMRDYYVQRVETRHTEMNRHAALIIATMSYVLKYLGLPANKNGYVYIEDGKERLIKEKNINKSILSAAKALSGKITVLKAALNEKLQAPDKVLQSKSYKDFFGILNKIVKSAVSEIKNKVDLALAALSKIKIFALQNKGKSKKFTNNLRSIQRNLKKYHSTDELYSQQSLRTIDQELTRAIDAINTKVTAA